MDKKIKIGDKVMWVRDSKKTVYTIKDINFSNNENILFQWRENGDNTQIWWQTYGRMNELVKDGVVIILRTCITPIKDIKKLKL